MWKRSRLIGLMAAVLAAMVMFSGVVQAQAPEEPAPPKGFPIIRDAGTQVTLTLDSQAAGATPRMWTWSLAPGESLASIQAPIANALRSAASASGEVCGAFKIKRTIQSFWFKTHLMTYSSRTWWCWNGTTITGGPTLSTDYSASLLWEVVGENKEFTDGGRGYSYSKDQAKGRFKFCIPTNGCSGVKEVGIKKTVRGDGTTDWSSY